MSVSSTLNNGSNAQQFSSHRYHHAMNILFPSVESCMIVYNSLKVDQEIRPDRCSRELSIQDNNNLIISWSASEVQYLRVSVSSFLESAILATDTLAQFKHFK